MRKFY